MASHESGWGTEGGAAARFRVSSILPPPVLLVAACAVVGILAGALAAWLPPVIVVGAIVAVIGAAVLTQHLQWDIWLLAVVLTILPFGALRLGIGFNPSFLNLAYLLIIVAWALWLLGRRLSPEPSTTSPGLGHGGAGVLSPREREGVRDAARPVALWVAVLVYVGLACVAFVWGSDNAILGRDIIRRFAEFLLAVSLVWLLPAILGTHQDVRNATRALIFGGGVAAAVGIVLYVIPRALATTLLSSLRVFDYPSGPDVLRFINNDPSLPQRATGTSIDPNAYGGLLIVVAAMTIPHIFARRPMIAPRLAWALAGMMALALFMTRSRGSMLGLLAAVAFVAFLRYRRVFIWLIIAVALILVLPWTQDYVASFFAGVRGQDLSTQMRLGEYKDAINLITRHPWIGVGYAGTPDIDLYIGVSSLYLLLAENAGLIGLAAFGAAMAAFFVLARRGMRADDGRMEPVILGGAAAIFGVLVAGVFDHYFVNITFPASVTLFWFIIGLTTAAVGVARRATGPRSL
ncbi:MAG: O-antigen ligase family protein [Anaerolineae bacterium]